MRFSRWIDHIPPWLALGAVVSTGIYEPGEHVSMVAPLLFAALAEWRRWDLGAWRRWMEILALVCFTGLIWLRIGLVPSVVMLLFLLSGIRLSLPREAAQRRQLLLMGFLIWITTAISTFEIHFLVWAIVWIAGAGTILMRQAWEDSASLRGGPLQRAPYAKLPGWTLGAVVISAAFFVILPRLTLGLRAFPWGVAGLTSSQAGLSDTLDLGSPGPIAPNSEIVLRVLPPSGSTPPERDRYAHSLSLLRGVALESLEGQRWNPISETPAPAFARLSPVDFQFSRASAGVLSLEYFVAPSPRGILPMPYGGLAIAPPTGMPIRAGSGGSLRWAFPSRRPIPLQFRLVPSISIPERAPTGDRLDLLTRTGKDTETADRWSRRIVPDPLPAPELAKRLSGALQTFRYTLDNPSGKATNPLEDFLERSRAGHCEYFASALALMLRYRGIPARVVNGYRLGPWIREGGYWLVTQNEAHSWVEFFDAASHRWWIADPTPPAPPAGLEARTLWAAFQRWTDAVRYRWDRHVVRFSDEDQMAGLDWLRMRLSELPGWRPGRPVFVGALMTGIALLAIWFWGKFQPRWRLRPAFAEGANNHGLKPLVPLLRAAGRHVPPATGETARHWIQRLSRLHPERAEAIESIADEVDAVAYGGQDPHRLKTLVKSEVKAWKRIHRR